MNLKKLENPLMENSTQREHRMISVHKFKQIREMKSESKSAREIAKTLKMDRKTVGRYVHANSPPKPVKRVSKRLTAVNVIQEPVNAILKKNNRNSRREVRALLLKQGFEKLSLTTVGRAITVYRAALSKEVFFPQVYQPGEQIQVDFKEEFEVPFEDGPKTVQLFVGSLPFSGGAFGKALPAKTFVCFVDGLRSTFEEFGGVPKNLRFDNLSPCVSKVGRGSDRIYTAAFKAATEHFGFGLLPCSPGKGSDKGHVERDIQTYERWITNAILNNDLKFKSFEHLNVWLAEFFRDQRTELVKEKLSVERQLLNPLPAWDEAVQCKVVAATVRPSGFIKADGREFSTPDNHIGHQCDVLIGAFGVEIRPLQKSLCSVFHEPISEGSVALKVEHFLTSLQRKPGAMLRWSHREHLFPTEVSKIFHQMLETQDKYRADKDYLKCLNWVVNLGWADVHAAMQLAIGSANPLLEFESLLKAGSFTKKLTEPPPLEADLKKYDDLIPNLEGKTNGLPLTARSTDETETHANGHESFANFENSQRKEAQPGGISGGTGETGASVTGGDEGKQAHKEIEHARTQASVNLRPKTKRRHHAARPRRAGPRGLGAPRLKRRALWWLWSGQNPHCLGNNESALPKGAELLLHYDQQANESLAGRETSPEAQQNRKTIGQIRSHRLRRAWHRFGDRRRLRALLSADRSALRKKKLTLHKQPDVQRMGQNLSEAFGNTGSCGSDSASLPDLPHQRVEPKRRRCATQKGKVDAQNLGSYTRPRWPLFSWPTGPI